jgi:hypothetical protein
MKNEIKAYETENVKLIKILTSSQTLKHLEVVLRYYELFYKKWKHLPNLNNSETQTLFYRNVNIFFNLLENKMKTF